MKSILILTLNLLWISSRYFTVNAQLALHVEQPKTILFGMDTTSEGAKLMWIPSKSAFRAGNADQDEWDYINIGTGSIALGNQTHAPGNNSTALGPHTTATGESSTALGRFTKAFGNYSTAMGYFTQASGTYSTATGSYTVASGRYSTSKGYYTQANGYASTVLGEFNDTVISIQGTGGSTSNTPLFIIGNGSLNNPSNALLVRKDGKVGIGTNHPNSLVHIKANSGSAFTQLLLEENELDYARMRMQNQVSNAYWDIAGTCDDTNSEAFLNFHYKDPSASGLNVLTLKGDGNATLSGMLAQTSDIRLKSNIEPVNPAISSALLQLHAYRYQWKNLQMDQREQIGLLAQEVDRHLPQLVHENEDGIKSVNYTAMIPLLIELLREKDVEIQTLREHMQSQMQTQEERFSQLESLLQSLLSNK